MKQLKDKSSYNW